MEIINETDMQHPEVPEFLWKESWNTIKSAATNIFHLTPVCFQNSVRNLREYDIRSQWQALENTSLNDVVRFVTKFVKKHYFVTSIVGGVAIGVSMVTYASLIKLALISSIKLLLLLVRAGKDIVVPAFKLTLKFTAFSMMARTICHINMGFLNPITSTVARMVIDPVSVFLTMGTMALAAFIFIASIPV
ncbi:MAG: hypothetical protein LBB17_00945 [Puniceicoccales bacterium]|jgi:hypothetical protein|nr:hypothetical protein [Puniceicoccales bacterium]